MKKPNITTIVTIFAIIIVSLYAVGEVDYYSSKIKEEIDIELPTVNIPSIGVNEKINNVSISQGLYHEEKSYEPSKGEVVLFGHRTLQGSPFLRLNELTQGDIVILDWPDIGQVNYTVTASKVVPKTYSMETSNGSQKIYLITCDPIGSTANRIIVEGNMTNIGDINNQVIHENPQKHNGLIISILFLIGGLIFTYFYPKENRIYILITVIILSIIIFYFYFFPIPPEIIYSKIGWINGGFMNIP